MIFGKVHGYACDITFDLLDPGNVVYHPNYLVLCDRARSAAFALVGYSLDELWKDGIALAVRENTSEYFRPVLMGSKISILTELIQYTGASLFVNQRLLLSEDVPLGVPSNGFMDSSICIDPKLVIHQLRIRLVSLDLAKFRPTRIPLKMSRLLNL